MTTVLLVKDPTLGVLRPATVHDAEELDKLDNRKHYTATLRRVRNPARLKLYWAILARVAENHPFYGLAGTETLHDALKLRLGLVDCIVYHDGSTRLQPRSIALDAMDETAFAKHLDAVLAVIETELLPGVSRDDLLRHAKGESQ